MMNPEIPTMSNCPFCGGNPTVMSASVGTSNLLDVWIECYQCGSSSPRCCTKGRTQEECVMDAAVAWNRRVRI